MIRYLTNLFLLPWILLDQSANALFGPLLNLFLPPTSTHRFGDPGEMLSSVLGKNLPQCRFCAVACRLLNIVLGSDHCQKAVDSHQGTLQDEREP
jgi:hypothetical protein